VVVVWASMPVGSANATARAASFKRDFFISFSFFSAGHYAPRDSQCATLETSE
jgi:hypothetical protein